MPNTLNIDFHRGELSAPEQAIVSDGFRAHSEEVAAPDYSKERVKWLGVDDQDRIQAVLTADIFWDWIHVDELWVSAELRGSGVGRELMHRVEALARDRELQGIWLWTQSWQAEGFYQRLGYEEFARLENFPKGHARIGFRKRLS